MTAIDRAGPTAADVAVAPTILSGQARRKIFLYLGILILMLAFGSPAGGLIDIPISFLLKNKLHLRAHEVAGFRLQGRRVIHVDDIPCLGFTLEKDGVRFEIESERGRRQGSPGQRRTEDLKKRARGRLCLP